MSPRHGLSLAVLDCLESREFASSRLGSPFLNSRWLLLCMDQCVYKCSACIVQSVWDSYLSSMYWTFTTLSTTGYGDLTPINDLEKTYTVSTMVRLLALPSMKE
eukprot:scaffold12301_cov18-Prasinocladus_malaysianus.AAC.2